MDIFHCNCLILIFTRPSPTPQYNTTQHTTPHHTSKHHNIQNLRNELSSVLEVLMLHDRSSSRIFDTDEGLCDYENERKELQGIIYEDLSKNEEFLLYKNKYKNQILELKKLLKEILREKKSKNFTVNEEKNVCDEVNRANSTLHSAKEGKEEESDSAVDGLVDCTVAVAAQPVYLSSILTSTSNSSSTSTPFCGVVLSSSRSLSSPPITTTTTTTPSIQCRSPSSSSSLSPSHSTSSSYNQSKCIKNHLNAATSIFAEVLLCVGGEFYRDKNDLMKEEILLHNDIKKCRKEVRIFHTCLFTYLFILLFGLLIHSII